jgi:hypothetical protein
MPKPPKSASKKPKRRTDIDRPHNGGQWSKARMTSFIKSALRGARWPQKYECLKQAFVGHGINPSTGRRCKLHKCPDCGQLFPQNGMHADHIVPVVGPEGFVSWDLFIARLYCEADGFRAVCKACHKLITERERAERAALAKQSPTTDDLL